MSARQALDLMQLVVDALAPIEQQRINAFWEQTAEKHTLVTGQPDVPDRLIERLSIELDGVLARVSVPMEQDEQQREGDLYHEITAGAVFRSRQGRELSEGGDGVDVDEPGDGSLHDVARRTALGDVGRHLSILAVEQGLSLTKHVVVLGDGAPWLWRLAGLRPGQMETLLKAIAALPAVPHLQESVSVPEQAIGSFLTTAACMRSPTFRAQGMQIGSAQATAKPS